MLLSLIVMSSLNLPLIHCSKSKVVFKALFKCNFFSEVLWISPVIHKTSFLLSLSANDRPFGLNSCKATSTSRRCMHLTYTLASLLPSRVTYNSEIPGLFRTYPAMCYEKYKHVLKKIQDTRNTVHKTMMPHSSSR